MLANTVTLAQWEGGQGLLLIASLFRAMGDKFGERPRIDWDCYSSDALVFTITCILTVLANRAEGRDPAQLSASSEEAPSGQGAEVKSQPNTAASSGSGDPKAFCVNYNQGLLDPNCGFRCRFCASACTRAAGHKQHSCYKCRRKK